MTQVNKAMIIGNLGDDPELRQTGGGTSVATLSVATSSKGKDGNEYTEWHRVVVWGKQAKNCAEYLSKGRSVYVEGRIQTKSWEDNEGVKKYSTEIVAQTVGFLPGPASVNSAVVLGNLGQDPELRHTPNGTATCTLSVATTDKRKDNDGNLQEFTEWHRVVVWGKQAENCEKYLSKGRSVYVTGRLQTRQWEDKDGVKRYSTEIVANGVQFIGESKGDGERRERKPKEEQSENSSSSAPNTKGLVF